MFVKKSQIDSVKIPVPSIEIEAGEPLANCPPSRTKGRALLCVREGGQSA